MAGKDTHPAALRVLIVDGHEVSRAAIRALLRTEGLEVVADVATPAEGLALADQAKPDIAIVDCDAAEAQTLATAGVLARLATRAVLTSSSGMPADLNGYRLIPKSEICARGLRQAFDAQHTETEESPMSMQAYLDTITTKTGRTPDEIVQLAVAEGLLDPGVKPQAIISWLGDELGLGRGHAMAIVAVIRRQTEPRASTEDKVHRHFAGRKAAWRPVYDNLVTTVAGFGPDTDVDPGKSYLSLRRAGKKFAIVQVTADRLDVGIKLKDEPPGGRLEAAGSWNAMVTHRVRLHDPSDLDAELAGWLERAYAADELAQSPILNQRSNRRR